MKFIFKKQFTTDLILALTCFLTYSCIYAFRKPFTIGFYENEQGLWGIHFKSLLIVSQVLGYTCSKFLGIKLISELKQENRAFSIIMLVILSLIPLFIFPYVSAPFNFLCLFLNGLPLGMCWGMIFSYVEGRRATDFIGTIMAVSFIIASGFVKSVALLVKNLFQLQDIWVPFYTGVLFLIPLILLILFLNTIPGPSDQDILNREERVPITKEDRVIFFNKFKWGLLSFAIIYLFLTLFRDIRDNFAADLWKDLGYFNNAKIFTDSEWPVTIIIFSVLASMFLVKNNKYAFQISLFIVAIGLLITFVATLLYFTSNISGFTWIIAIGTGTYLGYIPFNSILFDRMIALFKIKGNVGFFMYTVDSIGYLGSVIVIFYKELFSNTIKWVTFYSNGLIILSIVGLTLTVFSYFYFINKFKYISNV